MMILEAIDLKEYYGQNQNITKALDGVSLTVEAGEFVSIIGTSGSGKSTLLNMIGGLDIPTSGKVIVDNKDISTMKDEQLTIFRRKKLVLFLLNVYQNIVLPIELDGKEPDEKFMNEILHMLNLEDKLNNMPNNLSGGQQRVAIARALAGKAPILLADEPTGNLGGDTAGEIISIFQKLAHEQEKCVVVVTHSKELAQKADVILTLKKGAIAVTEDAAEAVPAAELNF